MLKGKFEQYGYSFVGAFLVFTGHIKEYIFPAVAPVFRQTIFYSLGTLDVYKRQGVFNVLPQNVTVKKGEALFPRIDTEKEIEELNKLIEAQMLSLIHISP